MADVVVERIVVGVRWVGAEEIAENFRVVRALLVEKSLIIDASVEGGIAQILFHLIAIFESFAEIPPVIFVSGWPVIFWLKVVSPVVALMLLSESSS